MSKPSSEAIAQAALIEARLANEKKSLITSYLLWFITGWWCAGHYFYLGQWLLGILRIILLIVSIDGFNESSPAVMGFIILAVWWVADIILIPPLIKRNTVKQRKKLLAKANLS